MPHFVANAPWDDRAVRRALAWALWGATARSPLRSAEYEVPADLRAYVERVVELASHVALPPDLDADLVRLAPGADVPAELRRRGSVGGGKGADGGARPLPRRRNRHPGRPPHA